jgi:acyl-CoA synthetase (AMP-forming)/AMP-acid ligase II
VAAHDFLGRRVGRGAPAGDHGQDLPGSGDRLGGQAGGWFHSGGLVREDEEGFLYVIDRNKDMIISGGENIYCAEVENVLSGHPAIADVAVIGARHKKWGETPIAVVLPADPAAPPTLEDLTGWTTGRLASYKKPTGLVVLAELPRNASGKVLKHELRARYGG